MKFKFVILLFIYSYFVVCSCFADTLSDFYVELADDSSIAFHKDNQLLFIWLLFRADERKVLNKIYPDKISFTSKTDSNIYLPLESIKKIFFPLVKKLKNAPIDIKDIKTKEDFIQIHNKICDDMIDSLLKIKIEANLNIVMGLNYTFGGFQPCAYTNVYLVPAKDQDFMSLVYKHKSLYSLTKAFNKELGFSITQSVKTDSQGRACFRDIPDGDYYVVALAPTRNFAVTWQCLIHVANKKVYDWDKGQYPTLIKDYLLLDGSNCKGE